MDPSLLLLSIGLLVALGSSIACLYVLFERDMLKSAIASGLLGVLYALLLFILMAPSILLVYVVVSVALTTILLVLLVLKTERHEERAEEGMWRNLAGVSLAVLVILSGLVLASRGGWFGESLPPTGLRRLAATIADNALPAAGDSIPHLAAFAKDAVAAVVWDYRGLDTFFETAVLYLAAIATLLLLGLSETGWMRRDGRKLASASPIAIVAVKLLLPIALVAGMGVTLATHPGGGFPGGAAIAGALVVSMVALRLHDTELADRWAVRLLALACGGTLAISLIALSPVVVGVILGVPAYILQNQPKADSPIGFPSEILGETVGGSIMLLEAAEALVVFSSLTLALMLLLHAYSRPREEGSASR